MTMPEYWETETVEVMIDDDGNRSFFLHSRDGFECLGNKITMSADTYAPGTTVTVREKSE